MKELISKIEKIKNDFQCESWEAYDKLNAKAAAVDAETEKVKKTDFVYDLAETYRLSLLDLEEVYNNWAAVQRKTKGLSFTMDSYIKTLKPRSIPKGGVEAFVDRLVEECQDAMEKVGKSRTVEDDIKPQKAFCQGLVDFRYVAKNADRLVEESGLPERERRARLEKLDDEYFELHAKMDRVLDVNICEGLKCRKDVEALRKKLKELCDGIDDDGDKLNGTTSEDPSAHRFLIGMSLEKVDQSIIDFAKQVYPGADKLFNGNGVYLDIKEHSSLIINAPRDYFESDECYDFLKKLYFSFASSLPVSALQICGMEDTSEQLLHSIASKAQKELGANCIFGGGIEKDGRGFANLATALREKYRERSQIYREMDGVTNFFDYNAKVSDNPQPLIVCIINAFPSGFEGSENKTVMENFKNDIMTKGAQRGIIAIVCQDEDASKYDKTERFDGRDTSSLVMNIVGNTAAISGAPISTDILASNFSESDFWAELKSDNDSSAVIDLEKMLKKVEKTRNAPPFYEKLLIPLGKVGGNQFNMSIKTASTQGFGVILGSSDSGKSTLLHTLILSAAYFYSPDELQMYLVDFKDGNQSPEFSNYIQNGKNDNMFIPHVRYLSLKSKKDVALDLFNKIEAEINNRSKMMSRLKAGTSNITVYNSSDAVKSGKLPKIPVAMFIIDESNAIFTASDKTNMDETLTIQNLEGKLDTILKRARAYGVEIIFSAIELVGALSSRISFINTRLVLNMKDKSQSTLTKVYSAINETKSKSVASELASKKGVATYSNDAGNTYEVFRVAFGGESGQAEHLRIAKVIRDKYANCPASKFLQTAAGETSAFPISSIGDLEDGSYVLNIDTTGITEEELKVKYDEMEQKRASATKYYLPMGVSSATTLKISLAYSLQENATNYYAFANESKLFSIERNVINAALMQKGCSVYYGSTRVDKDNFIKGYGKVSDVIKDKVTFIDDKADIARRILALEKLYKKRLSESEKNVGNFQPVFLILHKIEWLSQSDRFTDWVPTLESLSSASSSAKPASKDSSLPSDVQRTLKDKGVGADALRLMGIKITPQATVKPKQNDDAAEFKLFSKNDVVNALKALYEKGNRCGIFVLLASNLWRPIAEFKKDNDIADSYAVYGSYAEYCDRKKLVVEGGGQNCVYITTSSSVTRLFDYNPEKHPEWWKKLS